jgi:asparagine synthase (glutamine-hydrolysing)
VCGIAGIVAYRGGRRADADELLRIREAMAHRGPDGAGVWQGGPAVALAHRRLAIIDLDARAAQPMVSADGRYVVTFNGEIYNHVALRRDLERRGRAFRTQSDTEVLLHLYAERGEAMLHELRGMYAFGLWDTEERALFLARDPYGIKPLYYADDGSVVRFASEVKALLAGGAVGRALDPAGLVAFLCLGSVPEPHTPYREIRGLPAGHCARIDEGGVRERPFASVARELRAAFDAAGERGAAEGVCAALRDSIEHHLVADVPVGAFLSAGIDSGAIVGLMTEARQRVRTVTLACEAFRGTPDDEAPLAETVARRYDTDHATVVVSEDDFVRSVPRVLAAMDQPSVDGFNTWMVSRAAVGAGLKVAVSGLGGDELFGGYSTFREVPRWVRAMWLPSRVPGLGDLVRRLVGLVGASRLSLSPKVAGLVKYGGTWEGAYYLRRGLFMPWELAGVLPADVVAAGLERFAPTAWIERAMHEGPRQPFGRVATLEASLYMRNQLLRDTDWASMAHSLEVRVPLVDFTLLRRVASALPRLEGRRKTLLAGCPRTPLPDAVVRRPKTGFALPLGRWLADERTGVNEWRSVPSLAAPHCHWSRRLAYSLARRLLDQAA